MVNFKEHSLKNYSKSDVERWYSEGIEKVAKIMDVNMGELKDRILSQEDEIKRRGKFPTINDNSEERKELRRRVLGEYIELYAGAEKERKAVIILGQIASGKSSLTRQLEDGGRNVVVDVDFIKQGHGFMEGLRADFDGGRGTDMIHEEASMLAKTYLNLMSNYGYNLVIPKSGTSYSSINNIATTLKSKGYKMQLIYIDLPIKECVMRNFYRFLDESRRGVASRLVPLNTIEMIDDKPFKTFVKFLRDNPLFDDYFAYSNNVDFNQPMTEIDLKDILEYTDEDSEEKY